jgi:hypothetical protein
MNQKVEVEAMLLGYLPFITATAILESAVP